MTEANAEVLYLKRLTQDSIEGLRALLGRPVVSVYAPLLSITGLHACAPSLNFILSEQTEAKWFHRYLCLTCEWWETPLFLNDYWQITATVSDKPIGIEVNAQGALVEPCTISWYKTSLVRSIEIYEYSSPTTKGSEPVTYDVAILMRREDESRLCVACQLNGPGIAEDLHISDSSAVIEEFLTEATLRLTLC